MCLEERGDSKVLLPESGKCLSLGEVSSGANGDRKKVCRLTIK